MTALSQDWLAEARGGARLAIFKTLAACAYWQFDSDFIAYDIKQDAWASRSRGRWFRGNPLNVVARPLMTTASFGAIASPPPRSPTQDYPRAEALRRRLDPL